MKLKIFIISTLIPLINACSSLETRIPLATVKSPEVVSKEGSRVDFASIPAQDITTTTDASARPPVFTATNSAQKLLTGVFSYGFMDRLQLGIGLNSFFGLMLSGQYQFFGEKNKEGWISSIAASMSNNNLSKSGDQKGVFGPGGYPWKGTISQTTSEAGLSVGYRFSPTIMSYFGVSTNQYRIKTKIDQSTSTDNTDLGGSYENIISGTSTAIGLGLQFDFGNMHLNPLAQWTEFKTTNHTTQDVQGVITISFYN